ncbi:protein unc-13 homolog C-like [Dermacentor albipictus]|uniref:protein unc-13 homolog C-like n=1 Tax=Dermacentor albipictus TaxID=60249 RepID=UPI0031FC56AE
MSKPLLLLLQVLPCFSALASSSDTDRTPHLPHHLADRITAYALVDHLPRGVTSSAPTVLKDHRDTGHFRGHGTQPVDSMSKPLLLLLQVRFQYEVPCFRSDNRFLLVLPCPRRFWRSVADCWSMLLLLIMSGDIEENPGPTTAQLLQMILDNQTAADSGLNDIKVQICELNAKINQLSSALDGIQEIKTRIDSLEDTVRLQAKKLVEYENRSRRNNILIFGVEESASETDSDLKKVVMEEVFQDKLGIEVKTIERMHRLGRIKDGKRRPVIMRFYDYKEKEHVMKNCYKLKGSAYSVSNDYAPETVEIRKKLWESAASERVNGVKVSLIHEKLKIKDKWYIWDEARGQRREMVQSRDQAARKLHCFSAATASEGASNSKQHA